MFKSLRQIVQTLVILWVGSVCCSCSSIADARQTVAQADSLRAIGQAFTDSTAIATAVEALSPVRLLYPTDYARANYYYGRLLREHNDHPAAMQAFLRVVHSCTHDHAIKARAYSNIANMCRLATEHELAYDMHTLSAREFAEAGDTLMYFYAQNSMAYDLAEQHKTRESLSLINSIEEACWDESVCTKLWETRAAAYIGAEAYDSVLFCVRQLQLKGYNEPTGILFKARAFSSLGVQDSAVYYAQMAVDCTLSWFDLNNAYYILANDDPKKDKEEVLQVAADRSDVQKLIEIRQGQLSQAVLLLQQDLKRPPIWLIASLVCLSLFVIVVLAYSPVVGIVRKHKKVSAEVLQLQEQKTVVLHRTEELYRKQENRKEVIRIQVEQNIRALKDVKDLRQTIYWKDYDKMCELVDQQFYLLITKLRQRNRLSEKETRLCVLVLLDYSYSQIANILPYALNSVGKLKDTTAKKLGTTGGKLKKFLLDLILGE